MRYKSSVIQCVAYYNLHIILLTLIEMVYKGVNYVIKFKKNKILIHTFN